MGQCFKDLNLVTSNIGGLNDRQIKRSHIVLSVNCKILDGTFMNHNFSGPVY